MVPGCGQWFLVPGLLCFHLLLHVTRVSGRLYPGLRGMVESNGCFGSDGLDITANRLRCQENERVCIMQVSYGRKSSNVNISCPHAVAANVNARCCTPEPPDCVLPAGSRKTRDLMLECHYLSLRDCLLKVDRLDVRDFCPITNGITSSSFRSIRYACAPNTLVGEGEDPCKALPDKDDPFWIAVQSSDGRTNDKSHTNLTEGTASLLIGSLIGFSSFFIIFILSMILGIRCTSWMVDPETDKLVGKGYGEDDVDAISLRSDEIGRTILHKNYNIYITIPNQPRRPKKVLFSSNNDAKKNKKFFYNKVLKTPIEEVPLSAIQKVNTRFPLLEIPTEMEMRVESCADSGISSPPSYISRMEDSQSNASLGSSRATPSSSKTLLPKRHRPSSVEQRYQMLVCGDYFSPRRHPFGDIFAPRRVQPVQRYLN